VSTQRQRAAANGGRQLRRVRQAWEAVELARGELAEVTVLYAGGAGAKDSPGIMTDSGLHWIEPNTHQPDRVGFWTQGEPGLNRQWVPTWDYPDRLTTSERR